MSVVRLKKYNKRKGHLLRHYTVQGKRFVQGKWYNVINAATVDYLRDVYMRPGEPDRVGNVLAFDICEDMDEAMRLVEAERRREARGSTRTRGRVRRDEGEMREVDVEGASQRRTEMAALERIADDLQEPESDDVPRRVHTPSKGRSGPKPKPTKKAIAKKSAAKKPAAKKRNRKKPKPSEMPAELDAAKWDDDDASGSHEEVDPAFQ